MKGFESVSFKWTFRDYQKKVLDNSKKFLLDKKINIVAAPGSGKTILGLELIRRIGKPTIILSPTTTIKEQWKERFLECFINEPSDIDEMFSCSLKDLKLLTSITYQSLHSAMSKINEETKDVEDEESGKSDVLVDYTDFDLFRIIKENNIGTICLDEAHHLQNEWQKALEKFIETLKNSVTIISLTATPPYDAKPQEWERYISVCGEIDDEIFVPELVKQKTLCPHQDYIYFNYPTSEETEELLAYRKKAYSTAKEIFSLDEIKNLVLSINNNTDDYLKRIIYEFDNYKSLITILLCEGYSINNKLLKALDINNESIKFSLESCDKAITYLLGNDYLLSDKTKERLRLIIKENDLFDKNKVSFAINDKLKKKLISSIGKLESITEIVKSEIDILKDKTRILILTDFIRKESLKVINTEMVLSSISVVTILEKIRRDIGNLDIGVLSGTLVILPNSVILELEKRLDSLNIKFTSEQIGDSLYSKINIKDSNLIKVQVVSGMFKDGFIKILIGTKSLLGEGWDSPCINSLILASFVGSFMLSNQMRGRAIRIDKSNPDKASNIWHLVTIEAEELFIEDNSIDKKETVEIISNDFETIKRRFNCFVGPHYQKDIIESGVERISIINPPYNQEKINSINKEMIELSKLRGNLIGKWSNSLTKKSDVGITGEIPIDRYPLRFVIFNVIALILATTLFTICLYKDLIANKVIIKVLMVVLLILSGIIMVIYGLRSFCHLTPKMSIKTISKAVLYTLKKMGLITSSRVHIKAKDNDLKDKIDVSLKNATIYEQNIFNRALKETFSPIEEPRYIVFRKRLYINNLYISFSVPSIIGTKKENVIILQKALRLTFGNIVYKYTKNNGSELLFNSKKKSYITISAKEIDTKKMVN